MTTHSQQKLDMELLAPAGSFAAFEAAMEEGADAIYVGAPKLNARALSRDFAYQEIDALVRAAHDKGIKLYIAMNSLVKEDEVRTAVEGLAMFERIGPDALIIQDLGLFQLAREFFPELSLHASTLMSVHNALAVNRFTELGFKRVVLPRELTLAEIKDIHDQTGAELEVFVHGAMCFSYSGLCLFSSMFGGKSSLRGQCVQPCRRRYNWQKKKGFVKKGKLAEKDGGYLFSMHDLSGIDLVHELKAAGVASLKIEGRLKGAEYVRKVVRAYRLMLDNQGDDGPSRAVHKQAQRYLDEAMGRKRSPGFFLSSHPHEAVTPTLTGNIGLPAGKVMKMEEKPSGPKGFQTILVVELIRDIRVGERLRLHNEKSGERGAFTLRTLIKGGRPAKQAKAGQKVQIVLKEKVIKSRPGAFTGNLFKIDVDSGRNEEQRARSSLLKAKKGSLQLDETKVKHVVKEYLGQNKRGKEHQEQTRQGARLPIWFWVRSLRDRRFRLPVAPAKYIVPITNDNLELLRDASPTQRQQDEDVVWSLPPVIHQERLAWYAAAVDSLIKEGFIAFQLGHISQTGLFDEHIASGMEVELFANYTCNILNSPGLKLCKEYNLKGIQFSLETDAENLKTALQNFIASGNTLSKGEISPQIGMYVYGHPPLFTARLDDNRYRYGKRFVSPRKEIFVLERDEGLTRAMAIPPFSLLDVRQELMQYGVDYLVVDFTSGNMKKNLTEFSSLLKRRRMETPVLAGNFKTGLL